MSVSDSRGGLEEQGWNVDSRLFMDAFCGAGDAACSEREPKLFLAVRVRIEE